MSRKSFLWEPNMIEHLIDFLLQYKASMLYKSPDFDADKPMQYKELRILMAGIYEETEVSLFGQVNPINMPHNF